MTRAVLRAARIECRRPATWIAAGIAAGLAAGNRFADGFASQSDGFARLSDGVPWLCGWLAAMAAVAAIGELPAMPEGLPLAVARSLVPAAAIALVAAVGAWASMPVRWGMSLCAFLSTAAVVTAVRRGGATSADAAACGLGIAVVAAAMPIPTPALWVFWPVASAVVAWGCRRSLARDPLLRPRAIGRTAWFHPLPGRSTIRGWATAAAMGGCLAGMVAWLVASPPEAVRYSTLAVGVLAALAVPSMTLGDGIGRRPEWGAVLTGPDRRGSERAIWPPAVRIGICHVALVAWPLAVAALVALPHREPLQAILAAAAGIVAVGLGVTGMAVLAGRLGLASETAQALIFAALAAALAASAGSAAGSIIGSAA